MRLNFTNLSSLLAVVVTIVLSVAVIIAGVMALPEFHMTSHGWIALGLGSVLSIVVGGGLAAILIISRRRGYDEEAHAIYRDVDPSD